MADRRATATGKDRDGDITRLCNGTAWGSVTKASAISEIEGRVHTYYVQQPGTVRADVLVVNGVHGKYLRTNSDADPKNNLDNLPDC